MKKATGKKHPEKENESTRLEFPYLKMTLAVLRAAC